MKTPSMAGGNARGSRRLAFAAVCDQTKLLLDELERRVARLEADFEAAPISRRRGAWLERNVPLWIARERELMTRLRAGLGLFLVLTGGLKRLRGLEARMVAAHQRLLARVAEERAKGWPLKTLYAAAPVAGAMDEAGHG